MCLPRMTMALSACAPFDYRKRVDLPGDPAPLSAATRPIVIMSATNGGGDLRDRNPKLRSKAMEQGNA